MHGVSCIELLETPGSIHAIDAKNYFGIDQRPIKMLPRPHSTSQDHIGGYSTKRLPGYEEETDTCSIDQYMASDISGDEIFEKYVLRMKPVLIRGLLDKWPALKVYELDSLNKTLGGKEFSVSSIPYANKFGGTAPISTTLCFSVFAF